uniref:Uncharacterized protein n=1 Tax=Arundo donax TaxID=35708 RepID=A0A0A9DK00_ARUDO
MLCFIHILPLNAPRAEGTNNKGEKRQSTYNNRAEDSYTRQAFQLIMVKYNNNL